MSERLGMRSTVWRRAKEAWHEETKLVSIPLWITSGACAALPREVGGGARRRLLRAIGVDIGPRSTIAGRVRIEGSKGERLTIGTGCRIGDAVLFDTGGRIEIGDDVVIDDEVALITTSHDIGPDVHRAGRNTVGVIRIGDGSRIGRRATILPGVDIGPRATVMSGSVVTADVPAGVTVEGVPARPLRATS